MVTVAKDKPKTSPTPSSKPQRALSWGKSQRLERDIEQVNREIYKRNLELAQTNKTLALLEAIDNLVLNAEGELQQLCTKLAQEVVSLGYPLVTILGYSSLHRTHLETLGWATPPNAPKPDPAVVNQLSLRTDLNWFKVPDALKFVNLEVLTDEQIGYYCRCSTAEAGRVRQVLGFKAVACIKLSARQRLVGVMVIGFAQQPAGGGLDEYEKSLFTRLSEAVGIAIDHKMLLEENQRVLGQLERTNRRLRVLDRTKDDFISMASHQLRTPLTSVKGYVSMVLDNDAGKVSTLQRKLLNQAFVSAQRMTYLISDLLNVSRLRTGKFVIEATSTNLADVVQEEIEQLKETAKSRELELKYTKPQNFPYLMLDETKLRQVIMNFIDNAVHYTPSGKTIEVHLEDKPETIEFSVVDEGIGIPKSEQHHLFSKFYRARNAKRLRPDGTGLGLFMAKKVVVAQGGAVIFKSQEGRGSTFGFTFPKAKLTVPAAVSPPEPSADKPA